jgi:hypothetical protein
MEWFCRPFRHFARARRNRPRWRRGASRRRDWVRGLVAVRRRRCRRR